MYFKQTNSGKKMVGAFQELFLISWLGFNVLISLRSYLRILISQQKSVRRKFKEEKTSHTFWCEKN